MRLRSRYLLHATRWGGCHGVTRRDGRSGEDRWLDGPGSVVVNVAVPISAVRSLARRFPGGPRCSTPRRSSSPDRLRGGPSRSVTPRRACWDGLGAPLAPPQSRRCTVAEGAKRTAQPAGTSRTAASSGRPGRPANRSASATVTASASSMVACMSRRGADVAQAPGSAPRFGSAPPQSASPGVLRATASNATVTPSRGGHPRPSPARDHCRSAHSHSTARSTSTSPPPDTSRHHQGATR